MNEYLEQQLEEALQKVEQTYIKAGCLLTEQDKNLFRLGFQSGIISVGMSLVTKSPNLIK